MKDSDLKKVAREFRSGLLGERKSVDMCFAVCLPLCGFLSAMGFDVSIVEGEVPHLNTNHFWISLPDGRILDPTADQFKSPTGKKMPPVYLGEKPVWYVGVA